MSAGKPDMLITMGCGEEYQFISGVNRQEWNIPDPSGKPIEFMRNVRDLIEKKVVDLIGEL